MERQAGVGSDYSVLRCPDCKGKLTGGDGLYCEVCKVRYPIVDGIPVLFSERAGHSPEQNLATEKEFYEKMFAGVSGPDDGHCIVYGHERIYEFMDSVERGTVLEAGCGGGHNGVNLSKRGFQVTAMDLTLNGVGAARRLARREKQDILYLCGDIKQLPFADKEFDVCFCSLILHHFLGLDNVLKELSRVTKKTFVAFEVSGLDLISFLRFNVINPTIGISSIVKNQRALFPGTVMKTLAANGFKDFEISYEDVHHNLGRRPDSSEARFLRLYKQIMSVFPAKYSSNKFLIRASR